MAYPQCVVCKIKLDNPSYHIFKCSKCNRKYVLDYEVLAYEDTVGTAYDDDHVELEGIGAGGPGLSAAPDNELDFPTLEQQAEERHNRDKIPIPKYMKDGQTTTIEDFHEE
jgi:hypothetical protein